MPHQTEDSISEFTTKNGPHGYPELYHNCGERAGHIGQDAVEAFYCPTCLVVDTQALTSAAVAMVHIKMNEPGFNKDDDIDVRELFSPTNDEWDFPDVFPAFCRMWLYTFGIKVDIPDDPGNPDSDITVENQQRCLAVMLTPSGVYTSQIVSMFSCVEAFGSGPHSCQRILRKNDQGKWYCKEHGVVPQFDGDDDSTFVESDDITEIEGQVYSAARLLQTATMQLGENDPKVRQLFSAVQAVSQLLRQETATPHSVTVGDFQSALNHLSTAIDTLQRPAQ